MAAASDFKGRINWPAKIHSNGIINNINKILTPINFLNRLAMGAKASSEGTTEAMIQSVVANFLNVRSPFSPCLE